MLLLDLWQWGTLERSRAPLRLAALRAPHTAPWTPSAAQFASTETCSGSDAHAASPAGLARKRRNVARMEALDRGGGGAYLLAAQDPLRAPCGAGQVAGIDPARLPGVYADIGACLALAAALSSCATDAPTSPMSLNSIRRWTAKSSFRSRLGRSTASSR